MDLFLRVRCCLLPFRRAPTACYLGGLLWALLEVGDMLRYVKLSVFLWVDEGLLAKQLHCWISSDSLRALIYMR
jgi:hypothetical protein